MLEKEYIFNPKLKIRHMKNITMVYNEERGEMYELNGIAGEILKSLESNKNLQQLVHDLESDYDALPGQIKKDVEDILERFIQTEIINIIDNI